MSFPPTDLPRYRHMRTWVGLGLELGQIVDTPAGRGRIRGFVRVQRVVRKVIVVIPGAVDVKVLGQVVRRRGAPWVFDIGDVVPE